MPYPCRTALSALVVLLLLGPCAVPISAQTKRIPSDSDLTAIGRRRIDRNPNFYSLEKEHKLGETLSLEVQRSSKLITDPVATEYLERLATQISQNSDARFPVKIAIIDSDVINAATIPGGFQYVNNGLILQTQNEAELAGVLAHGIAYTALRTSTSTATKGELFYSPMYLLLLEPIGWAGPGLYEGLNIGVPLTYLKYRRDAEFAADYFGLQYLYKTGYDPEAYIEFLERVWPLTSAPKDSAKVFSPFPPLLDRIKAMRTEIIQILPQQSAAKVSSAEFDYFQDRLHELRVVSFFKAYYDAGKPTLRKK